MTKKLILLADDDLDDTELFCEALADIDSDIVCQYAGDGGELLKKLDDLDEKPELIFLDLNMPVMNGWECLKLIKEDPRYCHIPVIVISTSSHKKEVARALDMGALCYFVKPSNFSELKRILEMITKNLEKGLKEALRHLQSTGSEYIFASMEND